MNDPYEERLRAERAAVREREEALKPKVHNYPPISKFTEKVPRLERRKDRRKNKRRKRLRNR